MDYFNLLSQFMADYASEIERKPYRTSLRSIVDPPTEGNRLRELPSLPYVRGAGNLREPGNPKAMKQEQ